jgi:hypothetical protein
MASLHNTEEDELGTQYENKQLADVSADEPRADAPQAEDKEHQRIQQAKNAKRTERWHNAQNCTREPRDLNNAFAAVTDHDYCMLIGAIVEVALLAQQLVAEPLELFRLKRARHHLGRRQKLSALQTEQLIGLLGHRPIQPRLYRIDVGLPHTKMSPAIQQLDTFTPQDN